MRWMIALSAGLLFMFTSMFVYAADEATEKKSPATRPAVIRLVSPYSKMTTLTDELRAQIREIHRKALADKREIERKEMADIEALLDADQKKELREIRDKATVEKKKEPMEEAEK